MISSAHKFRLEVKSTGEQSLHEYIHFPYGSFLEVQLKRASFHMNCSKYELKLLIPPTTTSRQPRVSPIQHHFTLNSPKLEHISCVWFRIYIYTTCWNAFLYSALLVYRDGVGQILHRTSQHTKWTCVYTQIERVECLKMYADDATSFR